MQSTNIGYHSDSLLLKIYEKEQAEGLNRNDEILYIRQFLEELKTDMEEKNRYLEEVPQRMAEM